jgi:ketosteroid isomerase-like protein
MTWYRRSLLAVVGLALFTACYPQDCPEVETEAADKVAKVDIAAFEQGLTAIEEGYVAAYNSGDAAGIAALFTEDGMLSAPLAASVDPAGIEAMYGASFEAGVPMVLEVMREDYMVAGEMAIGWGAFQVTATPPEGEPFVSSGGYGSVMRMEADGTWKLFRHMYNYEVPPPGFGEGM